MTPHGVCNAFVFRLWFSRCLILSLVPLGASHCHLSAQEQQSIHVSMVRLLANPDQYHGKRVRVVGYVWLEFEDAALYFHKEDKDNLITKNAVEIGVPDAVLSKRKKISGHYAMVEGVFNAKDNGHLGLYSGVINAVDRVLPMCGKRGDKRK